MNRKQFIKSISFLSLTPSILIGKLIKQEVKVPTTTSWIINQGECINCAYCYSTYPDIFVEKNDQFAGFNTNTDCGTVGGTNDSELYGVGHGGDCEADITEAKKHCPTNSVIQELGAQIR